MVATAANASKMDEDFSKASIWQYGLTKDVEGGNLPIKTVVVGSSSGVMSSSEKKALSDLFKLLPAKTFEL